MKIYLFSYFPFFLSYSWKFPESIECLDSGFLEEGSYLDKTVIIELMAEWRKIQN